MLDTDSVFSVLAADDSDRRVASRRALALAHTRVENQLGAFLRGAVTNDEFDARLAQVREVVTAHVASACEETGHDHPEHIQASLIDHYRVDRRWQPRGAATDAPFDRAAGVNAMQPALQVPPSPQYVTDPSNGMALSPETSQNAQQQMLDAAPQIGDDQSGMLMNPTAFGDLQQDNQQAQQQQADQFSRAQQMQQLRGYAAVNPSEQTDNSDKQVVCPECGGDKKTANGQTCERCGGKGYVSNFGNSVLDAVASVVTADGEAGLGEPEPKMDKRKWTPQTVGDPDPGSTMHPTKRKDPLEVIPMTNRSEPGHELTEIGEQTTRTEDLADAASDDGSGFSKETPGGKGQPTKTFPKGDQASPVTRESVN